MRFVVPGRPIAKARPRSTTTNGRTVTYTPARTKAFEARVRHAALEAGVRRIAGPVRLTVHVYGVQGDWDNYGKAISDALNQVAYEDDKQVVDGRVYVYRKGTPRTEVEIESLADEEGVA